MRVLHVTAGDLSRGASRGALWLHQGLLEQGVDSRFLTTDPRPVGSAVHSAAPGRLGSWQLTLLRQLDRLPLRAYRFDRHGTLSPGWVGLPVQALPGFQQADVIHLHWINDGLLDLRSLQRCAKPIVWTVRDLWPITGLCHYPQGCLRQSSGCGHCPLLPSPGWPWPDPSHRGFRRKQRWLANAPITYVGISPWVARQLKASPITASRPVRMIWNCIDTGVFQPMAREQARAAIGLGAVTGPMLLAEWRSPRSEPWKGFQHLLEIMPALQAEGFTVVLFGTVPPELAAIASQPGVVNLGRICNDAQLRRVYAAADLFVCPTLEEAFGKTMAEAMACGTPVVAFNATAPADLVEVGVTGVLVEPGQPDALLAAVQRMRNDRMFRPSVCAERALHRFSVGQAAAEYQRLYQQVRLGRQECMRR
jgi:glycosyltransferase involved in cell wall biosynthesis